MKYTNIALSIFLFAGVIQSVEGNSNLVDAKSLLSRYNFPQPKVTSGTMSFKSKYTSMVLNANSRKLTFNNRLIWLNNGVTVTGGKWLVHKTDASTMIEPLLRMTDELAGRPHNLVVIDPGHGGKNLGATGSRKKPEKTLVLDIAKRTMEKLQRHGINVKLTRNGDNYLALNDRVTKTASLKASLFLSIHMNFAQNASAAGIETYITTPAGYASTSGSKPDATKFRGNKYDPENTALAYLIHNEMINQTSADDRGIKHARFNVIRDAPCPAVLIECGFLSNPYEESKLTNPDYRDKLAEGIAKGVLEYIRKCSDKI